MTRRVGVRDTMAELAPRTALVAAYRLRRARLALGWQQGELADKAGLTQALLSRAENAHPDVTVRALSLLAEAAGTDMTALTAECGHCGGEPRPWTSCLDCGAEGGRPASGDTVTAGRRERTGEQ